MNSERIRTGTPHLQARLRDTRNRHRSPRHRAEGRRPRDPVGASEREPRDDRPRSGRHHASWGRYDFFVAVQVIEALAGARLDEPAGVPLG